MADEELMSPETVGKYLAKSKAPKTQVTPVRKQDADFRITPSLTGPATIKRKLGDNEGYPRGFNPQQMGEVREAEATGRMALFSNSAMEDGRKHAEHEKALVRENVARSKFNPTDLPIPVSGRPLRVAVVPEFTDGKSKKFNTWGEYTPFARNIDVRQDKVSSSTVIHEIGHDLMTRDEDAHSSIKELKEPIKEKIKEVRNRPRSDRRDRWGTLHYNGQNEVEHSKLLNAAEDIEHGYHEGYASRFEADNYVQDPRAVKKGVVETPSAYKTAGFVGKFVRKNSRLSSFYTGYDAAGGPALDAMHPNIQRKYTTLIGWKYPSKQKYYTHRDYTYTGADLIKAVRSSRNSTDNELRNSNE